MKPLQRNMYSSTCSLLMSNPDYMNYSQNTATLIKSVWCLASSVCKSGAADDSFIVERVLINKDLAYKSW